jgi:hypothetical protein
VPIDFSQLAPVAKAPRPTDPIDLFRSLRVSDPTINDLWLAQGDALREWSMHRASRDIAIVLNTGAGKTLVGLLIAQSLVNETQSQVVYACSSIQLIEQTAQKAKGYGLDTTTYFRGHHNNHLYHQGLAPCVTTYHALFTGLSRFPAEHPVAIVFDDAHTAGHLLRDQFTLILARNQFPGLFNALYELFRPYFSRVQQEMGYLETRDRGDGATSRLVPPFAVREQFSELQRLLLEAQIGTHDSARYAWAHLQNHLDLCTVFVSGTEIAITPPVIPVHQLDYFQNDLRRVYLSATMTATDSFVRSFGRIPEQVIAPTTTAGECERLIWFPALARREQKKDSDIAVAKRIIEGQKALILVPSRHRRAEHWADLSTVADDSVTAQVEEFKTAVAPACLVLTARYDGIDLPGDTCRVMVIDDLPSGLNPLERYLWERLNLEQLLRSTIASRIVQSLGRISRGMSDHGVVILTGRRLLAWILAPRNQSLLPEFVQRQLQLGKTISEQMTSVEDLIDTTGKCLSRDNGWLDYYEDNMERTQPEVPEPGATEGLVTVAQREVAFGNLLWQRDYARAAHTLSQGLDETFQVSRSLGAWHMLWIGYCHELIGDSEKAQELYQSAHRTIRQIPPWGAGATPAEQAAYSSQVLNVAASLRRGALIQMGIPPRFDVELAALDGNGSVPATEAALQALGEYLGLEATRPDNEVSSGPDVVWFTPDGPALCVEAKTDKGSQSEYTKRDLGQLRDHRQWVVNQLGDVEIHAVFVGPLLRASASANPDLDTMVIPLSEFASLRDRLRAALVDISAAAMPITAASKTQEVLEQRRLMWPVAFDDMAKQHLVEIL